MKRCRVEFEVKSDIVFPEGTPEHWLNAGSHQFVVRNGSAGPNGDPMDLRVAVIGEASELRAAAHEFREILAEKLDWLGLITQARLEIVRPLIAIEWEAGIGRRRLLAFAAEDLRTPPLPELTHDMVRQLERLLQLETPEYVRVAAHAFRAALRARSMPDQFQLFWMSLEGVIEGMTKKDRVAVKCQYCGTGMKCQACGKAQERNPMATQAIRQRIQTLMGSEHGTRVDRALFKLRNTLMHGGSVSSAERWIQEKCGYSLDHCVNFVDRLAHRVIFESLQPLLDPGERIGVFLADSFTHGVATLIVDGELDHQGPGDHPAIPDIKLDMARSNKPFTTSPFGAIKG